MSGFFEDRLEGILRIAGYEFRDILTTDIDKMVAKVKEVYEEGIEEGIIRGLKEAQKAVFAELGK